MYSPIGPAKPNPERKRITANPKKTIAKMLALVSGWSPRLSSSLESLFLFLPFLDILHHLTTKRMAGKGVIVIRSLLNEHRFFCQEGGFQKIRYSWSIPRNGG